MTLGKFTRVVQLVDAASKPGTIFREILDKYKDAWEKRDPDLAVTMFTPDASYREDPFDKRPMRGLSEIREYWAQVPRLQKSISFKHGPVFHLEGSSVWGAEWEARYTKIGSGKQNQLRGVLFCEMKGRRVRRFWEYWHIRGGNASFGPVYRSKKVKQDDDRRR